MVSSNTLILPSVGTEVPFCQEDISKSSDGRTYMCRITELDGQWTIASRFDSATGRWISRNKKRRIGLMVFLNDAPTSRDTHIKISAMKPNGRAVWADPVRV
jgi:hypothetical protein